MASHVAVLLAAAEGSAGGNLMSVDTTLFIATIVTFLVFAGILAKFAWGPLLQIVDAREKSIREQVDSAEKAAADAKATLAQHQELLRGAARERDELLARAAKRNTWTATRPTIRRRSIPTRRGRWCRGRGMGRTSPTPPNSGNVAPAKAGAHPRRLRLHD